MSFRGHLMAMREWVVRLSALAALRHACGHGARSHCGIQHGYGDGVHPGAAVEGPKHCGERLAARGGSGHALLQHQWSPLALTPPPRHPPIPPVRRGAGGKGAQGADRCGAHHVLRQILDGAIQAAGRVYQSGEAPLPLVDPRWLSR